MEQSQEPMAIDRAWVAVGAQQDAGALTQFRKTAAAKSPKYTTITACVSPFLCVCLHPCITPSLCVSIPVNLYPCLSPTLCVSIPV